ncbi:unnamed protein product [Ceutorhynchus assimilis]|uniref:Uncharacterized protein n=1 Tax=Ceutorhynchus assimilis TaxID=467358 RepID=A0A9N9MZA8_9CUCU|nr:unnamed protein product [Ceutorhynchus assimilis]
MTFGGNSGGHPNRGTGFIFISCFVLCVCLFVYINSNFLGRFHEKFVCSSISFFNKLLTKTFSKISHTFVLQKLVQNALCAYKCYKWQGIYLGRTKGIYYGKKANR